MRYYPIDLATFKEMQITFHNAIVRISQYKEMCDNVKVRELYPDIDFDKLSYKLSEEIRFTEEVGEAVRIYRSRIED